MRLPNGFGQISKIKNKKLRKPYRAMVTVGKTSEGKPIVKMLKPVSYFKTYNDAYTALLEYNRNPYDLTDSKTLEQLYDEWLPKYKQKVSPQSVRSVTTNWKRCESIKDIPVREIRTRHCKLCIDQGPSYSTKKNIHKVLNMLLDYALEYDLTDHNYSRAIRVSRNLDEEITNHVAFTNDELEILWQHTDDDTVRMILIQCYSGWRPVELLELRSENINLKEWTMIGGVKTEAGRDRLVPIHEKIRGFVNDAMTADSEYLIMPHIRYELFRRHFYKVVKDLNLNPDHKPHDGRKTFITLCKKANVDEYAIKYMVGHAIKDITEKIYTDRDIEFLRREISKV